MTRKRTAPPTEAEGDGAALPEDAPVQPVQAVQSARQALADWLQTHCHNSPISRDTATFNSISAQARAIDHALRDLGRNLAQSKGTN